MASTIPLLVAIHENLGIVHWNLFIEVDNEADKINIQILGARQRYLPDIKTPSDARIVNSLMEILHLFRIDARKNGIPENIIYNTPIRNDLADWSCQDYVLSILDRLKDASIIDEVDGEYIMNKEAVAVKRESWDLILGQKTRCY
jgi:hypothetical protein